MPATKFQTNIEELKGYVEHLRNLLLAPEPSFATWHLAYVAAAKQILDFFKDSREEKEAAAADLIGRDVPLGNNPAEHPKPTCTRCGQEVPFFYNYVYRLQSTEGVIIFQAQCCPHAACRALFIVLPIGLETGSVATPGKPGWPGMPS